MHQECMRNFTHVRNYYKCALLMLCAESWKIKEIRRFNMENYFETRRWRYKIQAAKWLRAGISWRKWVLLSVVCHDLLYVAVSNHFCVCLQHCSRYWAEIQHVLTLKIDVSSNLSSYVFSAVVLRPHHENTCEAYSFSQNRHSIFSTHN